MTVRTPRTAPTAKGTYDPSTTFSSVIPHCAGAACRRYLMRQEHLRLDVNERRSHHQEFTGDVEVHLLQQVDGVEILLRDERDRNVVDIQLVLLDEVQQQIERPLEVFE